MDDDPLCPESNTGSGFNVIWTENIWLACIGATSSPQRQQSCNCCVMGDRVRPGVYWKFWRTASLPPALPLSASPAVSLTLILPLSFSHSVAALSAKIRRVYVTHEALQITTCTQAMTSTLQSVPVHTVLLQDLYVTKCSDLLYVSVLMDRTNVKWNWRHSFILLFELISERVTWHNVAKAQSALRFFRRNGRPRPTTGVLSEMQDRIIVLPVWVRQVNTNDSAATLARVARCQHLLHVWSDLHRHFTADYTLWPHTYERKLTLQS